MLHPEITQALREFESAHDVTQYRVEDIDVWPVLRLGIATRLLESKSSLFRETQFGDAPPGPFSPATIRRSARQVARQFYLILKRFLDQRSAPPRAERTKASLLIDADVAIVAPANRLVLLGVKQYHPVVDPLIEALSENGISSLVFETGQSLGPRWREPISVTQLQRDSPATKSGPLWIREPPWFGEVSGWAAQTLRLQIHWQDFENQIRELTIQADEFEGWFRAIGAKVVFLDCWYSTPCMAAGLAARRIGIPAVDFQHGVQGVGNFRYADWERAPEGGYALRPNRFWVWGEDSAQVMRRENPTALPPEWVAPGGNLWLNKWRSTTNPDIESQIEKSRQLCGGYARAILVTLQDGLDLEARLIRMIENSPEDWLWLIRAHRRTGDYAPIETRFRRAGHPGVNVSDACEMGLYALMKNVDAHVTGYSTCALEALAFGVPTMLIHPMGKELYPKYVEAGAMLCATSDEGENDIALLNSAFSIDKKEIFVIANDAFAPPGAEKKALAQLGLIKRKES